MTREDRPVTAEESIDLTPGDVWTEQQLVVVRDLAAKVHRAEAWAEQRAGERAAEAERDRDELARQLYRVLYDLHPVYPSTSGPYGGIGGAAMTPWCHVTRPHTDEHYEQVQGAEDVLRGQIHRAEREGYDLRAEAKAAERTAP